MPSPNNSSVPKRSLLFIGIFAASAGMGCESRPTNPGWEVMQDPPQELSTGRFQSVSFSINGQDLSSGVVELFQNEEISVEGSVRESKNPVTTEEEC